MAGREQARRKPGARKPARKRKPRNSLMNVGKRVDYALRALSYLASQPSERVVTRAEIEEHQAVPQHFLSKILRKLVSAELLQSLPGARGGFRLNRSPKQISFREVYEAIEGRLALTECVSPGDPSCGFGSVCGQRMVWRGAQDVLASYLDQVSVAEISDERGLVPRAKIARGNRKTKPSPRQKASARRNTM